MAVVGFPAPQNPTKRLDEIDWNKDLGKPYIDLNAPLDSKPPTNDLARYKEGSPATEILKKASGLIDGERNVQHGDRKECHTLIARLWTAYLGVQIQPTEVACMMALLKIARTKSGSFNGDCYVDGAGYMALAGELADHGC